MEPVIHKIYLLVSSNYHLMVVIKKKFLCGLGVVPIHYCRVCGAPYISKEEAKECEGMHATHSEEGAKTTPQDDILKILR
jgi:hypothetical protein